VKNETGPGKFASKIMKSIKGYHVIAFVSGLSLLVAAPSAESARGPGTLDDLKNLEIICFVPAWLPQGFKVTRVSISYDEPGPDEGGGRYPLYNIEYSSGAGRTGGEQTFSIDSAREGIGDRNLLDTDDSRDAEISSPLGRMFIIYTPKGNGKDRRKTEIKSNWTSDANMVREKAKDRQAHPNLGRYHGFSATGITVAEFKKIIDSLRAVRD
jgi:hypothetical protein